MNDYKIRIVWQSDRAATGEVMHKPVFLDYPLDEQPPIDAIITESRVNDDGEFDPKGLKGLVIGSIINRDGSKIRNQKRKTFDHWFATELGAFRGYQQDRLGAILRRWLKKEEARVRDEDMRDAAGDRP